jgi:DNA replication and repair protein RecF
LIRGGGGGRRRYLDFQAAQLFLEYRVALRTYERALRARNQLLKQGGSPPWAQIDAYSGVLIPQGQRLMDFRSRLVEALRGEVDAAHRKISECRETLSLRYLPAVEPDEDFAQVLETNRERDWQRGQTMVGPHRDELAIEIDGRPAARFASEGQQRTIALALKLGQLGLLRREREQRPLLLVDDIFGELDPRRRAALAQAFPEDSQQLMTTTSLQWLPSTEGLLTGSLALFDVAAGQVSAR